MKHFVEFRARAELELEKLRRTIALKTGDYMKIFSIFSDHQVEAPKKMFMKKAANIPLSKEEAEVFFDFFDSRTTRNGSISFQEFVRELAPSAYKHLTN